MGNIDHKAFNDFRDILVFIKGAHHYYGYLVIHNKSPELMGISETVLNVSGSEFIALNKALIDIKGNGLEPHQRIRVYCSCENVACVANGERNPELLSSQYETFKDLSKGLSLEINWVPSLNDGKISSDLSTTEAILATDRLNTLSAQMAEYREDHAH